MGAIQSYLWALMHPGFVEAIMPMGGVTETDASLRWLFRLMSAAIESDPAWRDTAGDYYHLPKEQHPHRGVMFGWSILFHSAMSFDHRIQMGWDEVQKEVFAWELQGKEGAILVPYGRNFDAIDLLYRNRAGESLNVTGQLHRIRARTLILHVANDHWVRLHMARMAHERIPGSRLCSFEHPLGHYALFQAPNVFRDTIRSFLEDASTAADGRTLMNRNAIEIFTEAIRAVDPYVAVKNHVDRIRAICREEGLTKIYVVGLGKAAYPMTRALVDALRDRIAGGVVVTKYGHVSGRTSSGNLRDLRSGTPRARREWRRGHDEGRRAAQEGGSRNACRLPHLGGRFGAFRGSRGRSFPR